MTPHPLRRFGLLLYPALFAVLAVAAFRFLEHTVGWLGYRYELDYGEGIVWQQALLIPGGRMYGDITQFPFIVFHYPPLYHLVARAVASLGLDGLLAGRLVSLISTGAMLVSMGALAWFAMRARFGPLAAGTASFVAATLPLLLQPLSDWAGVMRVDMLAMALGYAGILAASIAPKRYVPLAAGGVLFVAAIYTKQTAIAAPAATFGVLLLTMPRQALLGAMPAATVAVAAFAGLTWVTDGGFLRHIVGYNINRFDVVRGLKDAVLFIIRSGALALFGGATIILLGREILMRGDLVQRIREDQGTRISVILIVHAVIAAAMLPMVGKSGSSTNYLIEWSCAFSLLAALLVGRCLLALRSGAGRPRLALLVVPAMLLIQGVRGNPALTPHPNVVEGESTWRRIEAELRADGRPSIGDEMVLQVRSGAGVVWEPAIFAELASLGRWDEAPLLAMLERRAFAMVITVGGPGTLLYDSRYTPAVSDAILRLYPREERIGGLTLRRPPA